MTDQAHRALERANHVRSRRRELLDPIRRGTKRFAALDLDDPALESMTLYALLRSVRVNRPRAGARTTNQGGTDWMARRVILAFGCPASLEIRRLSEARKARLKEIVAAMVPAQRP